MAEFIAAGIAAGKLTAQDRQPAACAEGLLTL